MTLHFVKLVLGNQPFSPTQVSTEDCTTVDDLKGAIKKKLSPLLDSYATAQLVLCQPDGITEIDPATAVKDLTEIPWNPLVVTVLELPMPAPITTERTVESGLAEPLKKVSILDIPLPKLFDENEWKIMKELIRKTNDRIHDATLPKEKGKFFIVFPAADFNPETVSFFKRVGVKGKLFNYEDDLIIKNEAELSGSSGSDNSNSPDKDKKM